MRKMVILLLSLILALSSCASYTVQNGLESITVPSSFIPEPTSIAGIKALDEEKAREEARLEEERKAAEEEEARLEAQKRHEAELVAQAQAALESGIEQARRRNPYPEDLSSLTFPHVYRPVDTQERLDPDFTRLDVMLLNLGNTVLDDDTVSRIRNATNGIGLEFIFVTGALENQITYITAMGMDAVTLETGSIIFTTILENASASAASFSPAEGKTLDLIVFDAQDDMILSEDLDIEAWKAYLKEKSGETIAAIDRALSSSSASSRILAISSAEPSSQDWTIFTPYDYRDNTSWPVSEHLDASFSDSYRATHFSEEVDTGVTLSAGRIHERLDRLYSQGLMEVSSSTMAIPGLSDAEAQRYAVVATYILP